ncbi:hypothetical protein DAI22_10g173400 [Oryza sativa Japonica Group]|nr:hypothetical protein DAI22_10g173400 [Oryza sativa Japonica Group]
MRRRRCVRPLASLPARSLQGQPPPYVSLPASSHPPPCPATSLPSLRPCPLPPQLLSLARRPGNKALSAQPPCTVRLRQAAGAQSLRPPLCRARSGRGP